MGLLPGDLLRPLSTVVSEQITSLVDPIAADPKVGLAVSAKIDELSQDLALHGPDTEGLGSSWYPDAPWFLGKDKSKGIIRDIRSIIQTAMFDMAASVADGLSYQALAMQELGELQARYTNVYGVIK